MEFLQMIKTQIAEKDKENMSLQGKGLFSKKHLL